jgi:hypothetical protein
MIRCKFTCTSARKYKGWGENEVLYDYEFSPVTGNSEENKKFFKYTPSGKLNVSTVAENQFEVGKDYYLDLTLTS